MQHVKPSDEGEYICRAQNAAGMQEASATLYVRDKVQNKVILYFAINSHWKRCPIKSCLYEGAYAIYLTISAISLLYN